MKRSQRGFMLYDAIAALFVLSVVGFGTFQVYHVGIDQMHAASQRGIAARGLSNEWERLQSVPLAQLSGEHGAEFGVDMPESEILIDLCSTIDINASETTPETYAITLTIQWSTRGGRAVEEQLTGLRAF